MDIHHEQIFFESVCCNGLCGLFQIGKGEILVEGKEIAFLGYGEVVQRCLIAQSLLSNFGIQATVANARFCKPLDIDLIRTLCQQHSFLITVEEGTVGGFGSHVSQFISLDGLLDGRIKVSSPLCFAFCNYSTQIETWSVFCNGASRPSPLDVLISSNFKVSVRSICCFRMLISRCSFLCNLQWRPIVLPDRYIEHASLAEQFDLAGLTAHHIAATALTLLGRHRDALLLMK